MIVFPKSEIVRFLRAVDKALARRVDLVIIGGSAKAQKMLADREVGHQAPVLD